MRKITFIIILCFSLPLFASDGFKTVGEPIKLIGGDGIFFMQPTWSPNGSQIAFTQSNYQGLWVMNPDGSNIKQLSDEPAAGYGFQWSSDSRAIVSRVAKFEGRYRYNAIKLFDLEQNKTQLLTDYRTLMPGLPHWADADEKVYMFGRGKLEVFDSNKKATALKKTTASEQICFLKNDHIAVGNVTTKKYMVYEPVKGGQYINLVVSPDASKAAFEVIGGNLHVMNIDGTGLVDLGRGHRPQWSPDSQYLIFMITTDDGYRFLSSDLYTIKIDGSEKSQLTFTPDILEMNPSWSPDGKKITFDVMDEGIIYLLEISKAYEFK